MSRFSIAILVLIIVGFIMTVRRDEPESPAPSVNTVTPDKAKKPGAPAVADKTKKPGTTGAAQNTTPPAKPVAVETAAKPVTAPETAGAKTAAAPPEKTEDVALNTSGAITERQTPGNIPSSATATPKEAGILESGENLGRDAQRELVRLGCFGGNANERWGKESRAAIKRFNLAARYAWPDWPNTDLISSLRRYPDGFCKKCRGGGGGDCEIAAVEPDKTIKPQDALAVQPVPEKNVTAPVLGADKPEKPVTPQAAISDKPEKPVMPQATIANKPEKKAAPPLPTPEKSIASKEDTEPDANGAGYLPPSARNNVQDDGDAGIGRPAKGRKHPVVARTEPDEDPDVDVAPRHGPRKDVSEPRYTPKPYSKPNWVKPKEAEPRPPLRRYTREYDSGSGGGGGNGGWGVGGWPGGGPRSTGR